ncbi:protein kinase domain protein [Ichthyophthirius multifiliis]|uniref:Aurora kinase n=1 Tax=Ichthyophthirius multifiliis TaxID=5932 RepID=G0R2V5_ICHMU|nr:protein kinase domain protein [Ichthyophthirius multifiliis]EGR28227.1 protein kinase domain protein [Ichthyophthirius multifiliis]|eukprot:XP_004027572.1 protein kinase domain protein [Ichthyophthirius multifiliis]
MNSCIFKEKTLIFIDKNEIIQYKNESQQEIVSRKTRLCLGDYDINFENKFKLSLDNFSIKKKLGSGKFSDVYIAIEKQTGLWVALKQIKFSTIKEYGLYQDITNEIIMQTKLSHKNIIQLYGFFISNQSVYLIQELSCGKDLFTDMKAQHNKSYNESIVSLYIRQVADALHYMHMSSIIHRDIKPENIMICDGILKLCDFGYAAPFSKKIRRSTFCGTLDYVSPEMIENKDYNNSIDIWSLGILTYELIFGRAPFSGKGYEDTLQNVLKGQINFSGPISFECGEFITRLLHQDPNQRLKLAQALKHPFLKNTKNDQISVDKSINVGDFEFLYQ